MEKKHFLVRDIKQHEKKKIGVSNENENEKECNKSVYPKKSCGRLLVADAAKTDFILSQDQSAPPERVVPNHKYLREAVQYGRGAEK